MSSASHTSIRAPGTGSPPRPRTVPSTQHGSPGAPPPMSPPGSIRGASSTKNGPKTVASVASPRAGSLIVIVCMDAPRTSESRMNSCRSPPVMCPTPVRNSMAFRHSPSVRRTSRR
ncbi:hypothetical protein LUX39_38765 [Actinomadura madurae]|nr:hypothetical protein [Actinomadura madurae]MCP9982759.1 hypothetical protein [Actinomadura madurae]MCQ0018998.1 hypothetical protein [Actinomadura madurae]